MSNTINNQVNQTNLTPALNPALLGETTQTQEAKGVKSLAQTLTEQEAPEQIGFNDNATISPEALSKALNEREALKFGRLAGRSPEAFDSQKVQQFKQLVENGKIGEYLSSLNTSSLVDSILGGPAAGFLKTGS